MKRGGYGALLAAAVVTVAGAGCKQPIYSVLTDLPAPPGALGPPARTVQAPAGTKRPSAIEPKIVPVVTVPVGWIPSVREQRWRHIVIHHSATDRGSAASFDKMHRERNHWDEMGYHFVIDNGRGGPDGIVEVGSRWHKQKWGAHCGQTPNNEYNDYGIGICLVGNFQERMPSARQLASLKKLVRFLAERYGIAAANIIGHTDAPNARTACPGRKFHAYLMGRFRRELRQ